MASSKNCSAPLYHLARRPLTAVCLTRGIFLKTKVSTKFVLQHYYPLIDHSGTLETKTLAPKT